MTRSPLRHPVPPFAAPSRAALRRVARSLNAQAIDPIVMSERRTAADIAKYALEALHSGPDGGAATGPDRG